MLGVFARNGRELTFMNASVTTLTQNDSIAAALRSHWASNGALGPKGRNAETKSACSHEKQGDAMVKYNFILAVTFATALFSGTDHSL